MFKTVLFPVDASREAIEAANYVVHIVQQYDARLVLLSVVESASQDDPEAAKMSSHSDVAKLLENAKTAFTKEGIQAETIEREGKPPFVICDVADEIGANLIIMGSRGIGLTPETSHESVTSKVINLSLCPVLVIP